MKRGRNQRRRQGVNPNRAYDSNGPDVRIRGTANQIFDKYVSLARDAGSAGDRVKAENYLQHAEHYFRLLRAMQPTAAPAQEQDSDGAYEGGPGDRRPRERRDEVDNRQPDEDEARAVATGPRRGEAANDEDERDDASGEEREAEPAPSRRRTSSAAGNGRAAESTGEEGDDERAARPPRRKRRTRTTRADKAEGEDAAPASEEAAAS